MTIFGPSKSPVLTMDQQQQQLKRRMSQGSEGIVTTLSLEGISRRSSFRAGRSSSFCESDAMTNGVTAEHTTVQSDEATELDEEAQAEEYVSRRRGSIDGEGGPAAIVVALALLQQMQQNAEQSSEGVTTTSRGDVEQILEGFAKALESSTTKWSERGIERQMQCLFVSHANVFDEKMQNFIIQNYIQESDCAKTFRSALRRTSLVRRCLQAMYPADRSDGHGSSISGSGTTVKRRWRPSLAHRVIEEHKHALEVCPEIQNTETIQAVKATLATISSWDFDVFALSKAIPGQALVLVGNELFEKYELGSHFGTTKSKQHEFLQQIQSKYHIHPYHNAEHAADVAQTLHHFLSIGGLGETLTPRHKCAGILAAIIHDVGHTSFSNNFHIAVDDDLAVQYVYRSPLEHMHCALAFQIMKSSKCNLLQGLTRMEQLEIRNLITDMVLATDNSVHAAFVAKLEGLVCRGTDENWRLVDPDEQRLVLQIALHASDVSNPAKAFRYYSIWAERILREFYNQGDQERELALSVSIGYDRENPIPLEKMQAGFILGIVRPLFSVLCQIPRANLSHCLTQLDENLMHWQSEIVRKQQDESSGQ